MQGGSTDRLECMRAYLRTCASTDLHTHKRGYRPNTDHNKQHNKPRPRAAHRGIARFLGIDQKCNQVVPLSLHTFPENFMQIHLLVMLTNDEKEISIAASHGFSELTQNWIRFPMITPHLLWKFHANRSSHFLVILLTKKEIDRKHYPVLRSIGDGVIMVYFLTNPELI